MLKRKLQFDFFQLPESDIAGFCMTILGYLSKFNDRLVLSNLALALCILYMNAFDRIGNLLDGLENSLFKQENKEYVILEILKDIAEVAYEKTLVISK